MIAADVGVTLQELLIGLQSNVNAQAIFEREKTLFLGKHCRFQKVYTAFEEEWEKCWVFLTAFPTTSLVDIFGRIRFKSNELFIDPETSAPGHSEQKFTRI